MSKSVGLIPKSGVTFYNVSTSYIVGGFTDIMDTVHLELRLTSIQLGRYSLSD